jgi:NADH:ubiquinone reductase (non-electrogenic)
MRTFAARSVFAQLQRAGTRSYATTRPSAIANRAQWTSRPVSHQIALRQTIRQQSTEAPKPTIKPKKSFRFLRWTWRISYLSAIAGAVYVGYGIWEMRHPDDQPQPDPSKKTLVVLGELLLVRAFRVAPD